MIPHKRTLSFKAVVLSILCLALVSTRHADVNAQSFDESQQHAKALKASEGFGEFVDQYLTSKGVGELMHTNENAHEMIKVTPHRRTRAKSIKTWERDFRQPNGDLLKECLRDALGFGGFRRRMDVDDEEEDSLEYSMPSWQSGESFDEMHRRLQTCDLSTRRSLTVR